MRVKAPAGPLPGRFSSARLLGWAPPFPLVGKGMGMGGERLGARSIVPADRLYSRQMHFDFAPPTPDPSPQGGGELRPGEWPARLRAV